MSTAFRAFSYVASRAIWLSTKISPLPNSLPRPLHSTSLSLAVPTVADSPNMDNCLADAFNYGLHEWARSTGHERAFNINAYGMRTWGLVLIAPLTCSRAPTSAPSSLAVSVQPAVSLALAMAFAEFITGLHDIQATRYSQLASSAIIIFDHLITLDDEVELIWKSSWSMGKALFVINRYYTLISVVVNNYALFSPTLTDAVSLQFFRWQGWTGLLACMIAEVILQMRLYALYLLNKKVLALMIVTFIVSSASSAAIMGSALRGITARAHPIPGTTFCVPFGAPDYFFAFWIPIILFESLLCGLALYRGFQTFRASGSAFQSGRHLVAILIRDSVLYFLVMFATYFTNMLVWVSAPPNLLEIPIAFSVALSCCLGNRMILNVREVNSSNRTTSDDGTIKHHQARPAESSFFGGPAEQLSDIEMAQLRSMKAEQSYGQFVVL